MQRSRLLVRDLAADLEDVPSLEGGASGDHREEDAAQTEQVAPRADRLAADLLRAHVRGRADNLAGRGHLGQVELDQGEAEVRDLHPPATVNEHDVGRLDVPVDHTLKVRRLKPLGDLHADPQHLPRIELGARLDPYLERATDEALHYQVRQAVLLVDRVNRDDIDVADRRSRAGLAQEPSPRPIAVGLKRTDQLDRDDAIELRVEALEHDPHPAAAEDAEDLVMGNPAQAVGAGRRGEERQVGGVLAAGWQRVFLRRESEGHGLRRRGVRGRLEHVARGRRSPFRRLEPAHRPATLLAELKVLAQAIGDVAAQAAGHQATESRHTWTAHGITQ